MHPCVNDANDGCLVTALVTISYLFVVVIAVFYLVILFIHLLIYLFVFFPHSAIAGTHGNIKSQSFWFKVKIYAESFILETRIRYLNV